MLKYLIIYYKKEKTTKTQSYIAWDTIIDFMKDAFVAAGLPADEAEICADVLAESDRRGINSHGCNRFKPIYIDRINAGILNPTTEYEVFEEEIEDGDTYMTTLDEGDFKQAILIDFTNNYMHMVGELMEEKED